MDEEGMEKTKNDLIYIGHPIKMNDEEFEKGLDKLIEAANEETVNIKQFVKEIVTTYKETSQK